MKAIDPEEWERFVRAHAMTAADFAKLEVCAVCNIRTFGCTRDDCPSPIVIFE